MKKFLFTCIAMVCSIVFTQAQNQSTETVYLKNGSVIKGEVVEMIPGKQVKVKTIDGSLFVYKMEEVDKVVKDEKKSSGFQKSSAGTYNLVGFKGLVEFGYIGGSFYAPEFSFSLGYQINPYFFAGAGAGVQYLTDASRAAIPVFADLRGCFFLGKVSPYLSLKVGYEALINFWHQNGGFYASPTAGIKIMTTRRQAINIGIGLTSFKANGWDSDNGFTFKVGYEF